MDSIEDVNGFTSAFSVWTVSLVHAHNQHFRNQRSVRAYTYLYKLHVQSGLQQAIQRIIKI